MKPNASSPSPVNVERNTHSCTRNMYMRCLAVCVCNYYKSAGHSLMMEYNTQHGLHARSECSHSQGGHIHTCHILIIQHHSSTWALSHCTLFIMFVSRRLTHFSRWNCTCLNDMIDFFYTNVTVDNCKFKII